jgi:hypothetical protein
MSALDCRDPACRPNGPNQANAGAVALARVESPRLGEFEEPVILKVFGDVPDDFDSARILKAERAR